MHNVFNPGSIYRTFRWTIVLTISMNVFVNSVVAQSSNELQNALWLGDAKESPDTDSLMYQDDPAPEFRKEFIVNRPVKSATLYITAAGYYSAAINGTLLDQYRLDPAWTDYKKRVYFSDYDIRSFISKGRNCISVMLGNGFYNPLPLKFWGYLNLRDVLPVGRPVFIGRIKIVYQNGQIENIMTDQSWRYKYGPVMRNSVYLGEVYDARRALNKTDHPSADVNKGWYPAVVKKGPGGELQSAFFPRIQVIGIKRAVSVNERSKDVYVVDMGENFAGTFRVKLHGHRGDTVRFRLGERIYEDGRLNPMTAVAGQIKQKGIGGPGAPRLAAEAGMYIFGDDTVVEYSPRFSFAVYRYMELSGLKRAPDTSEIQGIALSANVLNGNTITTSNSLINSIQKATAHTFLSNLMSVQSDCPGREKFPYGGDLLATDEAFICNFEMKEFYHKVLYDWRDAMQDSVFIDTAPYIGLKYCGLAFESSIFDVQQNLYLYYGDTAIIRELYRFDLKWMDKAARLHPSGIVDKGLADHESLINVPVQLIGSGAYLRVAKIMKNFAAIMHDRPDELRFEDLEKKIRKGLKNMYWDGRESTATIERQSREASMAYINTLPEGERKKATAELQSSRNVFNKQTFYTLLLYSGVVPENKQPAIVDSLLKAIDEAPEGHFTTGIFGTKYILEELSRCGYADRVYNIINSTRFPGWGYMISKGATTLWETWKESDNTYSNCHPMFGSVLAWFYRWMAGIRPLTPGFRKFIICPLLPDGLSTLNCSCKIPQGIILFNWERKEGGYVFKVTVPKSSVAVFDLPAKCHSIKITNLNKNTPYKPAMNEESRSFELTAGQYLMNAR